MLKDVSLKFELPETVCFISTEILKAAESGKIDAVHT